MLNRSYLSCSVSFSLGGVVSDYNYVNGRIYQPLEIEQTYIDRIHLWDSSFLEMYFNGGKNEE